MVLWQRGGRAGARRRAYQVTLLDLYWNADSLFLLVWNHDLLVNSGLGFHVSLATFQDWAKVTKTRLVHAATPAAGKRNELDLAQHATSRD